MIQRMNLPEPSLSMNISSMKIKMLALETQTIHMKARGIRRFHCGQYDVIIWHSLLPNGNANPFIVSTLLGDYLCLTFLLHMSYIWQTEQIEQDLLFVSGGKNSCNCIKLVMLPESWIQFSGKNM